MPKHAGVAVYRRRAAGTTHGIASLFAMGVFDCKGKKLPADMRYGGY